MDKIFKIDIEEVKPESNYNAVCIIEANIEMDFLQPIVIFNYNTNIDNTVYIGLLRKCPAITQQEKFISCYVRRRIKEE